MAAVDGERSRRGGVFRRRRGESVTSQSRLGDGKLGGPFSGPGRRAMGCVESSEALSTEAEDDKPPAPAPAPEKGKKKKKLSIRSKQNAGGKKATLKEGENSKQQSENTKITVIWRRYSAFSSRRGSEKGPEGETAGPSQNPADASQAESSSP